MATKGKIIVAGKITSKHRINVREMVRIALSYQTKLTVACLLDGTLFATRDDKCSALEALPARHIFSPNVDQRTRRQRH